ncbi:aldo/keto reductase [Actinopolymorpha alba]|uniref:aldo/keto reductase n=1 Tax=Actinopolymorpha alba TaxID=533267 RepID=UPI0003825EBD|nr:aldo/keto reductase [Actinopolymorpha alba]
MKYRFLGRTGLKVSELCLGAMTFGGQTDEETSHQMLDRFVEAGGTFIDTADVYSQGISEEVLGRWLKTRNRDDLVIATKAYGGMGPGPNDSGNGRKHVLTAVEASLRRLGTDYIDLYQMHVFDDGTPLEETLSTLDTLVRSGKVRYIGASNYSGWQLQKAVDLSRQHGLEAYVCLQPLYNLLDREAEWELIPICQNEGLGLILWSPLRGGWLSGKYQRGMTGPIPGTRIDDATREDLGEAWYAYDNERTWQVIDTLTAVAKELGRSPAQVALRWLLQRPGVTAPIVGARSMAHFEDNLGAAGWTLGEEEMARLTEVSDRRLPYPYDLGVRFRRRPAV